MQETRIRTSSPTLERVLARTGVTKIGIYRKKIRRLVNKYRKRLVRYGILSVNIVMLIGVAWFVRSGEANQRNVSQLALLSSAVTDSETTAPIDRLSSADIAVQVALITNIDEAVAVTNQADTVNALLSISPADDKVVAKPQIVNTALKSKKDIIVYVAQEGDTISSLAEKFGITSDTIRWSNNLQNERLPAGKELQISPVNGIVYTVKAGDTPDSIAQRFRANKDVLIVFNDAELTGSFAVGERIVVPEGIVPVVTRSYRATYSYGGGYNGYDFGFCTWWAAIRRAQIGRPIPSNLGNASSWKRLAAAANYGVGRVPQAGAVIWTDPANMRGYYRNYGHVAFVEEVYTDGSIRVSEMNSVGWNVKSEKVLSAQQASAYWFIY